MADGLVPGHNRRLHFQVSKCDIISMTMSHIEHLNTFIVDYIRYHELRELRAAAGPDRRREGGKRAISM